MNADEYDEFVAMVAENGHEMGYAPTEIANISIVDSQAVGDEITTLHGLEPLADDPVSQTRLWPKDVITNTDTVKDAPFVDDLRSVAVTILSKDIRDHMSTPVD